MAPQQSAKFRTAFLVNFVPVWGRRASPIMHRFGSCFRHLLRNWVYFATHWTLCRSVRRWRHKICRIADKILQSVNNRMQSLREILRMVIIHIVINTLLGRLTLVLQVCRYPSVSAGILHGTILLFLVLFFSSIFIIPVNNFFFSINTFFAISILLRISFVQYPSSDIKAT